MFTSPLKRPAFPHLFRLSFGPSYATVARAPPKGLREILEKREEDVVITFAKRTAMSRAKKGQLSNVPVDKLLYSLFKATFEKTRLNPSAIDDICVGTCHPPSPLYLSRAAAIAAGIPHQVPISTVNRLCSSGLMAIRNIAHSIQSGEAEVGLAVGVESMSMNPRPTPEITDIVDQNPRSHDCIQPMGWTSEIVAQTYNVSREKQDHYAYLSHSRAEKALKAGKFASEIIPVEIDGGVITVDDTVRLGVTVSSLSALKPVFPQWGPGEDLGEASTTAGNASGVGDGAALCILTTRSRAQNEGWDILGKWVWSSIVGVEPRVMGISPVVAIPKLLENTGLEKKDVDLWEVNEAFASQFAYCVEQLGVPIEKINPNGGSIALTHPLGMTGARQVVTGLAELQRTGGQVLVTSMCIGSGMGAAGLFVNERV